jgi:high frequency lysogenization protein
MSQSDSVWQERMLAFAGMCLASVCVQQLARRGDITPGETSQVLIDSLLNTDPEDTEAVYGNVQALRPGLQVLLRQLDAPGEKDVEQTRYVVGMLQLERRLAKSAQAMNALGDGIQQIQRQRNEFGFEDDVIERNLGSLYSDVISPLGPRIQINGDPQYLKQPALQHKLRALLLAGIRSAVLWRQLGGKRRQVVFNRKQMVGAVRALLARTS